MCRRAEPRFRRCGRLVRQRRLRRVLPDCREDPVQAVLRPVQEIHRPCRHRLDPQFFRGAQQRLRAPSRCRTAVMDDARQGREALRGHATQRRRVVTDEKQVLRVERKRPGVQMGSVRRAQPHRRDQRAKMGVPLAIPRQHQPRTQPRAEDRFHPCVPRRRIKGQRAVQPVRVRQGQRAHAVLHGARHQPPRPRRARQHGIAAMYFKWYCHGYSILKIFSVIKGSRGWYGQYGQYRQYRLVYLVHSVHEPTPPD